MAKKTLYISRDFPEKVVCYMAYDKNKKKYVGVNPDSQYYQSGKPQKMWFNRSGVMQCIKNKSSLSFEIHRFKLILLDVENVEPLLVAKL